MMLRIILVIITLLAILGAMDSSYALHQHFAPSETSSCDVNETVSCTAVNQSEYSVFLGVPVAGIGVVGYLLIAGLASVSLMRRSAIKSAEKLMLAIAVTALVFSLWLTWVEIFLLNAICLLCMLSLLLITAITIMVFFVFVISRADLNERSQSFETN